MSHIRPVGQEATEDIHSLGSPLRRRRGVGVTAPLPGCQAEAPQLLRVSEISAPSGPHLVPARRSLSQSHHGEGTAWLPSLRSPEVPGEDVLTHCYGRPPPARLACQGESPLDSVGLVSLLQGVVRASGDRCVRWALRGPPASPAETPGPAVRCPPAPLFLPAPSARVTHVRSLRGQHYFFSILRAISFSHALGPLPEY